MKLIYLATSVIPAHKANAKQVMKMCQAFKQAGVDIELIIPVRFGGVRIKADSFEYYGIKERFKITKIFSIDLIPLEKQIGHLGFWLQNISFAVFTAIYLLFKKYDIIYTRDEFSLFLLSFFSKKLVWETHNFPKKVRWFHKILYKKINKIVVISQGLKEEFIKQGIGDERILVAPDSVDLAEFDIKITKAEARQKLNLPLDKKLVVYTGHLFPWKGVYTLAESSKYLSEDTAVIFVGGMKDDLAEFNKFVQENNLEKVKVLDYQEPKSIPYYLKAADVLVLPNSAQEAIFSQKYTSPLKLFEYLAAKQPIVASDLPAIREILMDEETVFVRPDDPLDLAAGIKQALTVPKMVYPDKQKYTWQNRVKTILNFIKL